MDQRAQCSSGGHPVQEEFGLLGHPGGVLCPGASWSPWDGGPVAYRSPARLQGRHTPQATQPAVVVRLTGALAAVDGVAAATVTGCLNKDEVRQLGQRELSGHTWTVLLKSRFEIALGGCRGRSADGGVCVRTRSIGVLLHG